MKASDIDRYLERIGFSSQADEDPTEKLVRLHRRHSFAVPFECFDPFCGNPVSLSASDIVDKIVQDSRGGYCFELNLIFFLLLENMGYQAKSVLCRPFSGEGAKLPLTHRMSIVEIGQTTWIADVGLGGNGWIDPLEFVIGKEQLQFGRAYRIKQESDTEYIIQTKRTDRFVNAVAFGLQWAEESDFEMANYYTSTCASSPFVNRMMCTIPTESGRYSIRDTIFKIEDGNGKSEQRLTPENIDGILDTYFGILLPHTMREKIYSYLEQ